MLKNIATYTNPLTYLVGIPILGGIILGCIGYRATKGLGKDIKKVIG